MNVIIGRVVGCARGRCDDADGGEGAAAKDAAVGEWAEAEEAESVPLVMHGANHSWQVE